jgi:hypothetical protein
MVFSRRYGQAVFIRNPLPRYRPRTRVAGNEAFELC